MRKSDALRGRVGLALRFMVLALLCLAVSACVARKAVTVPVKATGAVIKTVF